MKKLTFSDLGLSPTIINELTKFSIIEPTLIQQKTIASILNGDNIVFQSETGTGKTFAYVLPLVQRLLNENNFYKNVIIVSPTFELASQSKRTVTEISDLKASLFIGGVPVRRQIEMLKNHPAIISGTPARLCELIKLRKLKTQSTIAVVLDEADRLFSPELKDYTINILSVLPNEVQIIACSATITKKVEKYIETSLMKKHAYQHADKFSGTIDKQTDKYIPQLTKIELPQNEVLKHNIEQWAIFAETRDKIKTLKKFISACKPTKTIIFTSRPDQVENIVTKLRYNHIQCEALHSGKGKQDRKNTFEHFKKGTVSILITSDLASRGLDIPDITHIIQMDFPSDKNAFIHRAGRTGRAGNKGINVVIGDEWELRRFAELEKKLGLFVYPKVIYNGKLYAPSELDFE